MFSKHKDSGFPYGCGRCAHAAATDGQRGSNVYKVNQWLWQFGRGKPRLGGLTIEQTSKRKDAMSNAQHKRAAETVHLGGLTSEQPSKRKDVVSNAQHKRAAETVHHRKAAAGGLQPDLKYMV